MKNINFISHNLGGNKIMKNTTTTLNNANNDFLNFTHNDGTTYDDITKTVDTLARMAAAGTLKKIYTASAHEQILQYIRDLQADFILADNMVNIEKINQNFSDAYDIYLIAYEFLHEKIGVLKLNPNSTITKTQKNGTEKIRTVYQWACVEVRRYIYNNKGIEANGKYIYIEDLKNSPDDSADSALDREYIRIGKYHDIHNYHEYTTTADILDTLELSAQHQKLINLRLQGKSTTEIAEKFGVSQQAISKQLAKIQDKIKDIFPDMIRGFKDKRIK